MRGDLPNELPGHWRTGDGAAKAREYAALTRKQLDMSDMTDMELANAIYLLDAHRHSIGALPLQTAAKDRIRWLSVQLALARARPGEDAMAALVALVGALDRTKWSSWQLKLGFQQELDAARAVITHAADAP